MIELLLVSALVASIVLLEMKDLLHAVILLAAVDAMIGLVFYMMGAPDIAITQFAVTAGISTLIFIVALGKTRRDEE
ncbi:MAG: hypothetical protein DRO99_02720 [Candidatus Aenigmatarchaeota archaeon]|nr:MAG: hypothetical protein DRO99_02720 [Candidatus Aenigmarchaeota archaeon]